MRWLVNKEFTKILPELMKAIDSKEQKCEIIRNGHFRRLLKYTVDHETFYIKQYTIKGWIKKFQSLFLPSKAKREWNHGLLLQKYHVPTAKPVAIGEKRHFGIIKDCCIIMKEIPNSVSLRNQLIEFNKSPVNRVKKRMMLKNLLLFLKNVHDKGFFHGELHADNIMVDINNITIFYLIDLGRVKFRKAMPLSRKVKDLSRLLYSLTSVCTNEEIRELVKTDKIFLPRLKKKILRKIHKIKHRIWRSRTKKCFKKNDVFRIRKGDFYKINMRAEWGLQNIRDLLEKHTIAITKNRYHVLKISSKTGISIVPINNEKVESVCIKEYRYPHYTKRIVYSFFSSPARKSWGAAHGLLALHFPTPQPVALCEKKRCGILEKSFIVMKDISAYLPTNTYVTNNFSTLCRTNTTVKKKRDFIACLADTFRNLHDSGVYHSDLKANNILVEELHNTWKYYFLDLDRVYFYKRISKKKKVKNLSQLNASLPYCISYTDRIRFYKKYMKIKKTSENDKKIIRNIVAASVKRKHVWYPRDTTHSVFLK